MKYPIITLSISAIMIALFILFGGTPESIAWFSATPVEQPWRLFSAHFMHSDVQHLAWNVGAFLLLGSIIEQRSKGDLLMTILIGVIGVNAYLILFYNLGAYVGLSGVLNSVLVVVLHQLSQDSRYRTAALWTLVLSMLKIVFELQSQQSIFTTISWEAVPEAHLAGWVAGVVIVFIKTVHYFSKNKFERYKQVVNV